MERVANRRLHGIAPDRGRRDGLLERVHPEDADRVNALFRTLMQAMRAHHAFRVPAEPSDRGPRVLSSIARAVRERDRVVRHHRVTRDITQERQASDQLRRAGPTHGGQSSTMFVDAIIAIDTTGGSQHVVQQGAERIFGYSAQQMLRKSISMLMPADHSRAA